MGYTHYWNHRALTLDELIAISEDARNIILASELPIAGWDGTGEPTFVTGDGTEQRLGLNGADPEGCETFSLSLPATDFDFCKTRRLPYDVVVTATLLAAKDRLKDGINLSSDGDPSDWEPGLALAERALDRKLTPFGVA